MPPSLGLLSTFISDRPQRHRSCLGAGLEAQLHPGGEAGEFPVLRWGRALKKESAAHAPETVTHTVESAAASPACHSGFKASRG